MRTIRVLALTALFGATAFVSAGPPWVSIEYPANPYDSASRNAFLLVHAFHHGTPVNVPVSGTAEGIVSGERRTVSLEFKSTSRPGVYALDKQWPTDGVWTLVIAVTQGKDEWDTVRALVELGADGQVASVTVPTTRTRGYLVPASVSIADVDARLRARVTTALSRR